MEKQMIVDYLAIDQGDAPCSRYGRSARYWQPWAIAVAEIVSGESGEPITPQAVDYAASLVVNDSPEPLELVRQYGKPYGYTIDPDSDPDRPELLTA